MNISDLAQATYKGNNLTLTWVDTAGSKRTDNMSPRAQQNLLIALLTEEPTDIGQSPKRGTFVAGNVRAAQAQDGTLLLHIYLSPKSALHIAFPGEIGAQLKKLLAQDPAEWRDTKLS